VLLQVLTMLLVRDKEVSPSEVVLGGLGVDPASDLHELYHIVDPLLRDARLQSHILRVEVHVAFLDSFHTERSQSS